MFLLSRSDYPTTLSLLTLFSIPIYGPPKPRLIEILIIIDSNILNSNITSFHHPSTFLPNLDVRCGIMNFVDGTLMSHTHSCMSLSLPILVWSLSWSNVSVQVAFGFSFPMHISFINFLDIRILDFVQRGIYVMHPSLNLLVFQCILVLSIFQTSKFWISSNVASV